MSIPVWHDDQQGSATVVLAGLLGALALVNKRLDRVRIVLVGIGAANVSTYRLLVAAGAVPGHIVACDRKGILHGNRDDLCRQQETFAGRKYGVQVVARKFPLGIRLERMPRFVSFDAGIVAGLLCIGSYLAISNRHWTAAAFLFLGVLWMISIPIRLRARKSSGR